MKYLGEKLKRLYPDLVPNIDWELSFSIEKGYSLIWNNANPTPTLEEIDSSLEDLRVVKNVYEDYTFTSTFRTSVEQFLKKLTCFEVVESMEIAVSRGDDADHAIKYFCKICWNKIKGDN
jgi:hypothetical protein